MDPESRKNSPARQNVEEQNENNPAPQMEGAPEEGMQNPAEQQIGEQEPPRGTSPAINETLNKVERQLETLTGEIAKLFKENSLMKREIERLNCAEGSFDDWRFEVEKILPTMSNSEDLNDLEDRVDELEESYEKKFKNLFGRCNNMSNTIQKLESSRELKNFPEMKALLKKTEEIMAENKMFKENKIMQEEICALKKELEETKKKQEKLSGIVTDYNFRQGTGHIKWNGEKIYVNYYGIVQNNPNMIVWELEKNQAVEFNLIYRESKKRFEAINVTGPKGQPVKGFIKEV